MTVSIRRLMILSKELFVEVEKMEDFQNIQKGLGETFSQEIEAEWIIKNRWKERRFYAETRNDV
jgi:hypothetical protein